ncbi:MAG: helix-turn-helix transcriptional regulator [Clostridia bacterium]|nr:helix-turn-helix transcriptional regulator [Clostridia bacterium]
MSSRKEDGYNKILPTRIRQLLEKKRLRQSDLAEKAGISRQSLGNYADGSNIPNAEVLAKIAKALDTSADYLLGISESEDKKNPLLPYSDAEIVELIEDLKSHCDSLSITINDEICSTSYDPEYDKLHNIVVEPASINIKISNQSVVDYFKEIKRMEDFFSQSPLSATQDAKEYQDRVKKSMLNDLKDKFYDLPF